MSDQAHFITGRYEIQSTGSMNLEARGESLRVSANGPKANLLLMGESAATLAAGHSLVSVIEGEEKGVFISGGVGGSITQIAGTPALAPRMQITPEHVILAVGPPDLGASIKLTATEIVLQIGPTKLSLTPTGITEALGEIKREVSPLGHQLTAGPSSVQVNVTGLSEKGPMKQEAFDAATTSKQALASESTDGVRTIKAGVLMLG